MKRFIDGLVTVVRFLLIALICAVWFAGLFALLALVFLGWGKSKASVLWRQSSFMTLVHELR